MLAVGVAALAAVLLLGALSAAVQAASVPDRVVQTEVRPGESLWQIAQRSAPEANPAAVIDRIMSENGLVTDVVQAGQVLTVPAG